MAVKSCVICNKIYMATEHLNHHMVSHHGLGLEKGDSRGQQNDAQGRLSGQERTEPNELKQQETNQPVVAVVKCKYCGETLQADQALGHFYTAHPGEKIEYERDDGANT